MIRSALAITTVILLLFAMGAPKSYEAIVSNEEVSTATTVAVEIPHETISQLVEPTIDGAKSILQEAQEEAITKASKAAQKQISLTTENIQRIAERIEENKAITENLINNLSEWALAHDNSDNVFNIWKKSDKQGNLLVALKNEQEEIVIVFKFEGMQSNYNEWVLCMEGITSRDICDYAFTAYREVGGRNPKNVQAQVCVLLNRQNYEYAFADTIREVVTEPAQYSCSWEVVNRCLKSDSDLEREDLEKCFQQAILVLAGELIQSVPENVLFAARGSQGSGVWQEIDGTKYCFL